MNGSRRVQPAVRSALALRATQVVQVAPLCSVGPQRLFSFGVHTVCGGDGPAVRPSAQAQAWVQVQVRNVSVRWVNEVVCARRVRAGVGVGAQTLQGRRIT